MEKEKLKQTHFKEAESASILIMGFQLSPLSESPDKIADCS